MTARFVALAVASSWLAACGQPDTATRDAVKAPIDKAEAVQGTVDEQAAATRAAVDAQTDAASAEAAAPAGDAPATAPPP